jgi:4'-phosphopantetheinyl transferase
LALIERRASSAALTGSDLHPGKRPGSTYAQPPSPADITIWWLDLDIDDNKATRWFGGLTEGEQARANRFVRREHQRRFVACRYQLRQILGQLSGIPGSELRFRYGSYGKPEILGDPCVHFSVAHSEGVGVIATCTVVPVGVDLEVSASHEELAFRVLTRNELATFRQHPGDKDELFLQYWTGKEAFLKLWGVGLSLEPSTIEIDWTDPPICRPLGTQPPWLKSAWLSRVAGFAGTVCTIACSVPPLCTIKRVHSSSEE